MLERAFAVKEIVLSQEKERIISVMEQLLQIEKFEQEKEFLTKENKELADALEEVKEKNESLLAAYEEIEIQQHLASKTNVELESANQKLLNLNEEKNELLGIVAHDLKNIAGSISINSSNILNYFTAMSSDKILRTTQVIKKSSDHMLEVIINLLDQNALETGKMTLVKSSFNFVMIIEEVIQLFQEHANKKNITIVFEKLVSHAQILTDKNRTKDVVSNVISNAIKYSPIGKTVYISLDRNETIIIFSVKDEGPGFTNDDKANLFKKYTRLTARPTGGENSTGLGLSITKRLIEEMGGTIELDNNYTDGAHFIIQIPMA
jgi:signal transduction histidine kinase